MASAAFEIEGEESFKVYCGRSAHPPFPSHQEAAHHRRPPASTTPL